MSKRLDSFKKHGLIGCLDGKMEEEANWFDFKREPFFKKDSPLIIYTKIGTMIIVYWMEDGWKGPDWYSADEYYYYREENILYWMQAPKPPKKPTTTVPK